MGVRKFQESGEVLDYLKNYGQEKEVMVPLTSSLYVPGVIEESGTAAAVMGDSFVADYGPLGQISFGIVD